MIKYQYRKTGNLKTNPLITVYEKGDIYREKRYIHNVLHGTNNPIDLYKRITGFRTR